MAAFGCMHCKQTFSSEKAVMCHLRFVHDGLPAEFERRRPMPSVGELIRSQEPLPSLLLAPLAKQHESLLPRHSGKPSCSEQAILNKPELKPKTCLAEQGSNAQTVPCIDPAYCMCSRSPCVCKPCMCGCSTVCLCGSIDF
eukprot:TRINITY_DN29941_c0_g1_i2.p1 TRINITY_DN29941_c0_g1~~TRINITY_DN29941_c0_g1_i2.p1  ORF type:complete len:157 (-),score=22.31 TRINITY_DN29941_c0_g1_i2:230-652(-)